MNIFKQFILSLYSPKSIASFRNQGIGKTILFIFFLSLVSIIPSGYYFSTTISSSIPAIKSTFTEVLPEFTIKNGVLSDAKKDPVIIEKDNMTIYMDDSGEITAQQIARESITAIGFLQNELVFATGGEFQSASYSLLEGQTLSNKDIEKMLDTASSILPIALTVLVLAMFLFTSALLFIKVSIFAMFSLLFNNSLRLGLSYRHLWRITAYSVTLSTVFFTIMAAFQTVVPFGSIINWFVTFVMLYLSLKEVPKNKDGIESIR
ncbi:DUF1189 domain-containing protein [Peribacillus huizhouensis]|uniref:DUF1189 domain-containing protein n=1 Tax=Peribacillus huizhouensis TaxID=1501239 RepID=A0ABR6CK91_9BACI|nr:DUF1189 domain-containing protein [Peribacillus huizhouensis]MBA9025435.1 hypothetical protein [Peribacillus huizhouensis]